MKTVSLPFCIDSDERIEELFSERILSIYQGLNAKRISLYFGNKWLDMERNVPIIQRAIEHFGQYNIEVAVWLNSFLHNGYDEKYTAKKYADGADRYTCPLDQAFIQDFALKVAAYANTGVPLIYLDDDFRIGVSGGLNCFCNLHMREYKKLLGEDLTMERMASEILSGKPSIYRESWAKVNGIVLKNVAKVIREEVDKVNPLVRVGLCASPPTMFGFDGVTAFELSEILAGNTKPFLRTIGAPYWATSGRDDFKAKLGDIIGLQRLQAFYAMQHGFKGEMIAEGDTYPRPRTATPASFLELFHSAVITENRMDGILKYLGEYTCKGLYETGYSKLALKNVNKMEQLSKAFFNTEKVGFRVFEIQDKSQSMEILPDDIHSMEYQCTTLHASIRALNDASMPYVFSGAEPVVAVGDNARYLAEEDMEYGVFTDIVGAKILQERGFDVGIDFYGEMVALDSCGEEYKTFTSNEYVCFHRTVQLFDLHLSSNAEILTCTNVNGKEYPLTYRYENKGRKIVVTCVDMTQSRYSFGLFYSYSKQKLLASCYEWLVGRKLPALCFDCPMLMPIIGKKEEKLIVGLWNIFEDEVSDQIIYLDKEYSKVECIGCTGKLQGATFILDSLLPFDYCAIILE